MVNLSKYIVGNETKMPPGRRSCTVSPTPTSSVSDCSATLYSRGVQKAIVV